jgi:hypothetical protein
LAFARFALGRGAAQTPAGGGLFIELEPTTPFLFVFSAAWRATTSKTLAAPLKKQKGKFSRYKSLSRP